MNNGSNSLKIGTFVFIRHPIEIRKEILTLPGKKMLNYSVFTCLPMYCFISFSVISAILTQTTF